MASATHHQRSSSASINPSTLIESCRVFPHNGGAGGGVLGSSRTAMSSSSQNISTVATGGSQQQQHHNKSSSSGGVHSDTHSSECDAELPVCFCEKRHVQKIEGIKCITQSWRMKERVSFSINLPQTDRSGSFTNLFSSLADENGQRCASHVPKCGRRPTRCRENPALCPDGVLD